MRPDCREHIQHLPVVRPCVTDPVRRQERKPQTLRDRDSGFVACFLFTIAMTLQLDINAFLAKGLGEPFDCLHTFVIAATYECFGQRSFLASCQTNQTGGAQNQDRTVNEVMLMSKANVYSGTDAVSKRSLIGRSEDVRSHSQKPSSSRNSPDSTSGFEPLFDSVEAARLVRIHPKTVVRMARRGQISGITHSHTTEVA
jgi:hypothetical protein